MRMTSSYLATLASVAALLATGSMASDTDWVRRGIEINYFGTPLNSSAMLPDAHLRPAITSPDGRYDLVEMYRGDVDEDVNRYKLLLFSRTRSGIEAPRDLLSVASRDTDSVPGLDAVRWSTDSRSVLAVVAGPSGNNQIERIDLDGNHSTILKSTGSIVDFSIDRTSSTIAYMERPGPRAWKSTPAAYSGSVIGSETIYTLLRGQEEDPYPQGFGGGIQVMVHHDDATVSIQIPTGEWPLVGAGLSVSPDGRYVVIPVQIASRQVPQAWRKVAFPKGWLFFMGYRLFDRATGRLGWAADGPVGNNSWPRTFWAADSRHLLITSALMSGRDGKMAGAAAIVDVSTGNSVRRFEGDYQSTDVGQEIGGTRLSLPDEPGQFFRIKSEGAAGWRLSPIHEKRHVIEISEARDRKPTLVDHDLATGRSRHLFDPNPELDVRDLNPVREYHWRLNPGTPLTCGLYMPRHMVAGRRYPLIIQTHDWMPEKFWYDGPSSAGFAAQALAAAGFIVAQLHQAGADLTTTREGPASAETYDTLIDALDKEGLVDIAHVGITAWSRTGIAVRYALAFGRHKYAAAVLADSSTAGYLEYLVIPSWAQPTLEGAIGSTPFGAGLVDWQKRSPMFNYDRITTPVRVLKFGPRLLAQWEDHVVGQRLDKPVEQIWLPTANHWPIIPSERMEAQQGTVDWYRYWLKGERSAAPQAGAEIHRWEDMKAHFFPSAPMAQSVSTAGRGS